MIFYLEAGWRRSGLAFDSIPKPGLLIRYLFIEAPNHLYCVNHRTHEARLGLRPTGYSPAKKGEVFRAKPIIPHSICVISTNGLQMALVLTPDFRFTQSII